MILVTRNVSDIAIRAFGKESVSISTIEDMFLKFPLDPDMGHTNIEAYILSSKDVAPRPVNTQLVESLQAKHPKVIVVVIADNTRSGIDKVVGVDAVLLKPVSVDTLITTLQNLTEELAKNQPVQDVLEPVDIEEYAPTIEATPELEYEVPEVDISEPAPAPNSAYTYVELEEPIFVRTPSDENEIFSRIKKTRNIAEINAVMEEISATRIVKDLMSERDDFYNVEQNLIAIKARIQDVMLDTTITNVKDKMALVGGLMYDREGQFSIMASGVEQRLAEIIQLVTQTAGERVEEKLREIDVMLKTINVKRVQEEDFARAKHCSLQRSDALIELATLQLEIKELYSTISDACTETAAVVSTAQVQPTGHLLIDTSIRQQGAHVVTESVLNAIESMIKTSVEYGPEYSNLVAKVTASYRTMLRLMDLDDELMEANAAVIRALSANNAEETAVARTLLKQSIRGFVAEEGTGATVVPLMRGYLRSRMNANVLMVYINGCDKLDDYNVSTSSMDDLLTTLENRTPKDFMVVKDSPIQNVDQAVTFVNTMTKAAGLFKEIYVVLPFECTPVTQTILNELLSITFITTPNKRYMNNLSKLMKEFEVVNVGKRVIVNRGEVTVPILELLGISGEVTVQVTSLPDIHQIQTASISSIDPRYLDVVCEKLIHSGITK